MMLCDSPYNLGGLIPLLNQISTDRGMGAFDLMIYSLADIVQQRAQKQQIRPLHLALVPRGLHGRLHQVAVHGESVHGVALRRRPAATE